jgi:hypothetical protein
VARPVFGKRRYIPLMRHRPEVGVAKSLGLGGATPKMPVRVDSSHENITGQSCVELAQLGSDLIGLADLLVQRVEDLRDAPLLGERR